MNNEFYLAFEAKFRGSRDLIKSRLQVYIPFVNLINAGYPNARAADLGCGRGEWLEILQNLGLQAKGVDLDEGMLKECRKLGLNVEIRDAINFLKEQADESLAMISGFHIVEHVTFAELQQLYEESHRVLQPGGLLILETPNPENISVATSSFYLDPSHERPIPSQLLVFLSEHYGYSKAITFGLNHDLRFENGQSVTLLNVLNGVSPDYTVIAQKEGGPQCIHNLLDIVNVQNGLTLATLAAEFESRLYLAEVARKEWEEFKRSLGWKLLACLNKVFKK